MKYIDADRLLAEIERLYYNESEKDESILAADAYKNALDAIEKVIDSLQQEQPKFNIPSDGSGAMGETPPRFKLDVKEQSVKGLEEAAYKYTNSEAAKSVGRAWLQRDVRLSFIAGAEWQKAKMLEVAVEGTVVELGETYKDLSLSVSAKELNQVLQPLGLEDGDKVKIIIVKEDK